MTDFQYPYDLNAESCVIGSMLLEPNEIVKVKGSLLSAHFYHAPHQVIYKTLVEMSNGGIGIDVVTLKDQLLKRGLLERAGDIDGLVCILESVPTASNLTFYAHIVKEKYIQRETINQANKLLQLVARDAPAQAIAQVKKDIATLQDSILPMVSPADMLELAIQDIERSRDGYEISTGIDDLDPLIMGLRKGAVYVMAGDTSHGKTAVALNFVKHNLTRKTCNVKVAYYTYDMSSKYIALRLAGLFMGVNVRRFCLPNGSKFVGDDQQEHSSCYSREELESIKTGLRGVLKEHGDRLLIRGFTSLSEIEQDLACGNADIVVIDYIQTAVSAQQYKPLAQAIGDYMKEVKRLADKYNACFLVLSQFHRTNAEQLSKKSRQLSDIKESSSIEQGADVIIFLEWVYRTSLGNGKSYAEAKQYFNDYLVRVMKNNIGGCGLLEIHFDPILQNFRSKETHELPF